MAVDIRTAHQQIGILQQSKASNHWSAPRDETADFLTTNYDAGVSIINPDKTIETHNYTSANGLTREEGRIWNSKIGAMPSMPFDALVNTDLLAAHFAALFQNITEGASGDYNKVGSFPDSQVDFANNGGYLFTVCEGSTSGDAALIENAVLSELTLTFRNISKGRDHNVSMRGAWVGNNLQTDKTISGSWASMPTSGLLNSSAFTLNLTVDSTAYNALCWRTVEITFTTGITSDCLTTGGKPNNFKMGMPSASYRIEFPYNSSTKGMLGEFNNGTNANLDFSNGTGTSDGELAIALTKGDIVQNPKSVNGEDFQNVLQVDCKRPTAGWGNIISMADAIDWGF